MDFFAKLIEGRWHGTHCVLALLPLTPPYPTCRPYTCEQDMQGESRGCMGPVGRCARSCACVLARKGLCTRVGEGGLGPCGVVCACMRGSALEVGLAGRRAGVVGEGWSWEMWPLPFAPPST